MVAPRHSHESSVDDSSSASAPLRPNLATTQHVDARPELPGVAARAWDKRLGPLLEAAGQPRFRLRQLMAWVFQRGAPSFEAMSDLPRGLRSALAEATVLHPVELELEKRSTDGTRKYLWRRARGEPIESVWIPDGERDTFCISSQAGCPVACTFCATGFGGFTGQLTAGEIVDQVLSMRRETGVEPTNLVFMGMGEPLLNFDAVMESIDILCDPRQVGLGARRLTVSTVGVPRRIVELAARHPQVKLAVSLHAARDRVRDEIIPLNRQYPLGALLEAVREHHRVTGKMTTWEYIVLPGVNDAPDDVNALVELLAGIPSRVNLLSFNPFPGSTYERPTIAQVTRFRAALAKQFPGPVTIRRSRGEDIQGACGQLTLAARRQSSGS